QRPSDCWDPLPWCFACHVGHFLACESRTGSISSAFRPVSSARILRPIAITAGMDHEGHALHAVSRDGAPPFHVRADDSSVKYPGFAGGHASRLCPAGELQVVILLVIAGEHELEFVPGCPSHAVGVEGHV